MSFETNMWLLRENDGGVFFLEATPFGVVVKGMNPKENESKRE